MSESKPTGPIAWIAALIVAALGAFGILRFDADGTGDGAGAGDAGSTASSPAADAGAPSGSPDPAEVGTPARPAAPPARDGAAETPADPPAERPAANDPDRPATLEVRGPEGSTDLVPTLRRIERGERHEHRNDGSVFQNREGRLPAEPRGYYREYVHPTPGVRGPGAQRLVIGRDGDVWYTPDHYESFRRIRWRLEMGNGR